MSLTADHVYRERLRAAGRCMYGCGATVSPGRYSCDGCSRARREKYRAAHGPRLSMAERIAFNSAMSKLRSALGKELSFDVLRDVLEAS